jgi:CRP/FNR family transcriptional regulator, cyclic AMP receptor protein
MDVKELKSVELFSALKKNELQFVARHADEVDVAAGTRLATEGRFAYEFFVIEDGTAEVIRDGTRIATLGPGDFFGEIGLLETERRTASVVAQSEMRLVVLTDSAFKSIEREMPSVAQRIRAAIKERMASDSRLPAGD